MELDFDNQIKKLVEANKIDNAIELAENNLKKIPVTNFHKVLGRDFLKLTDGLVESISYFYEKATKEIAVQAIYSEMNGFTINYDLWFLQLFAFETCGGLEDTDWLGDYEFTINELMVLSGMEDIQSAYENYMKKEKWNDKIFESAKEVCDLIIILRFQELFKKSIDVAKQKKLTWSEIPIFATAHDYDILYRVNL